MLRGVGLNLGQHLVDFGFAEQSPVQHDSRDFRRVADIFERVGFQQDQIRTFAFGNCAKRVLQSKKYRRIDCRGLQRLQGREPGLDQQR